MRVVMKVDDRDVQAGIDGMRGRGTRLHSVFKTLRPMLRNDLKQHARFHAGPEGSWPARAPSTMAKLHKRAAKVTTTRTRRTKDKTKIRERRVTRRENILGGLPGGVSTRANPRALVAESPVEWAGVHNEGGIAGHGVHIPARPFVFLSDEFLARAEDEIGRFVFFGWTR